MGRIVTAGSGHSGKLTVQVRPIEGHIELGRVDAGGVAIIAGEGRRGELRFEVLGDFVRVEDGHGQTLVNQRWSIVEKIAQVLRLQAQECARRPRTEVVLVDGEGVAVGRWPWRHALQLAHRLRAACKLAEENHWAVIEPYFTDGVRVKRILGLPLLESKQQLERLG